MNKWLIRFLDRFRNKDNNKKPEIATEERTPRIHEVHGGWGHHIEFDDFDSRSVWGHLPIKPEVGDLLTAEMGSGKTAVFRFIEVENKRDPPDMFFAKVEDVGYADDETGRVALSNAKEVEKTMFL